MLRCVSKTANGAGAEVFCMADMLFYSRMIKSLDHSFVIALPLFG